MDFGTTTKIVKEKPISSNLPTDQRNDQSFEGPRRVLYVKEDLVKWQMSQAYHELFSFVQDLADSVKGIPISHQVEITPAIQIILGIFVTMEKYLVTYPPYGSTNRYGNIAFKDWFNQVIIDTDGWMKEILSTREKQMETWEFIELASYFKESLGNNTRIDYGTGHETAFVAWMYCLYKLGVVSSNDKIALVTRVFAKYIDMIRNVQLTYRLEPAGSHGSWGLDDYQFLSFAFGAHQLIGHKEITPKSVHNHDILNSHAGDFMYLSGIQFIHRVKTGPFYAHSPMLNDISNVGSWEKVASGLIKMYKAEVLEKFVVIQHFVFGKCLSISPLDK